MKKVFLIALLSVVLSSCILTQRPSVCDKVTQPSILCEIANKNGFKLENVGLVLVVSNAIAIGEGVYTKDDALGVLYKLDSALNSPITYAAFRFKLKKEIDKYPGLFELTDAYIAGFNSPSIIYPYDKAILKNWINERIRDLGAL